MQSSIFNTAHLVLAKDSIFPVTRSNFVLNFVKAFVGLSVYADILQIFVCTVSANV